MSDHPPLAIVAGVGPGLGTALCRTLGDAGYVVAGIARSREYTEGLETELNNRSIPAQMVSCDLGKAGPVRETIDSLVKEWGPPDTLIYNAGAIAMHAFAETPLNEFDRLWEVNCRGAFLCASHVVPLMQNQGHGSILFTGASASVKAAANFAAFGAGKFALRGMAQAMARELGPQGIHVAHVIIDGMILTPKNQHRAGVTADNTLQPDAIARTYLALINQDRSAWTQELDLRPDVEGF